MGTVSSFDISTCNCDNTCAKLNESTRKRRKSNQNMNTVHIPQILIAPEVNQDTVSSSHYNFDSDEMVEFAPFPLHHTLDQKTMQLLLKMDPETPRMVDIDIDIDLNDDRGSENNTPIPTTIPVINTFGSRERLSQMFPIFNAEQLGNTIRAQYDSEDEGSSLDLEERKELASVKAYEHLKTFGSDFVATRKLYRHDTERSWESEDIDDLHCEMSQQFEALKKQESTVTSVWSKHADDDDDIYMCSEYDSEYTYESEDAEDTGDFERPQHCLLRAQSTEQIAREKEDMTRHMMHLVQMQQASV